VTELLSVLNKSFLSTEGEEDEARMMQQQVNTNTSVPITTAAGILNLDHYKYLRSLLPPVPHFIESLSFTDLNNWECQIYVNLLTESDCMKWLADFEEKTSTDWKVDQDASRILSQTNKIKGCHWQMVYRCIPNDSKKECTAKLEMKIVGQDEHDRSNRNGKQYPCQVSINFYHNHNTTNNTMFNMESFKSQDIPSHLKEGFEGYFQETMQPTNNITSNNITTTVNLNAIKPQHTLLNSPITHSLSNNSQVVIKTEVPLSPVGQHLDGKLLNRQNHDVFDLAEVSQKLDLTLEVLRTMLKQTGTACAAVKQFVEKFDKLKSDQNQLEDALTSFGGQWDWLVATDNNHQQSPQHAQQQQPQQPQQQQQQLQQHHIIQQVPSPAADLGSPKKKSKKKKKEDESSSQVFSTNIVGGQVVVQQAGNHLEGPDAKRRKRARCGTCAGCLNRDKTQDCRQCRNCLDQKRYGGPGRLKKACIKRQCVVISQMIAAEITPEQKQSQANLQLQQHQHHQQQQQQQQTQQQTQPQQQHPVPVAIKSDPVYGIKSEPVFSIKSEPVSQVISSQIPVTLSSGQTVTLAGHPVSMAPTTTSQANNPASTLLSWPGTHYAPTFQVQVQQPVQFAFQPQSYSSAPTQIQYTSQLQHLGTNQLETIATEAARHHGMPQ